SMWIGNGMLLLLNLPLIGIWVKLLQVPYRLLFPIIMTMMGIGIYSLNSSGTDVLLMAFFGFVGYVLAKLGCSFPPLILAMVLAALLREGPRLYGRRAEPARDGFLQHGREGQPPHARHHAGQGGNGHTDARPDRHGARLVRARDLRGAATGVAYAEGEQRRDR